MRKLLALAALVGGIFWLLRRRNASVPRAAIGYADGSSLSLEPGSPELDRLTAAARRALGT
jgi:hypothetical protein